MPGFNMGKLFLIDYEIGTFIGMGACKYLETLSFIHFNIGENRDRCGLQCFTGY